jgi:hypothetical protein
VAGGTSVAAAIITAVYALAGNPAEGTYPASYPYQHASRFYDVTTGANGTCEPQRRYLCHGEPGYDGPTGLGTPDGIGGFSGAGAQAVTLLDPGTQDLGVGARVTLTISAVDRDRSATSLSYTATGLPPGMAINPASGSLNGLITHAPDRQCDPAAVHGRWSRSPASRGPLTGR